MNLFAPDFYQQALAQLRPDAPNWYGLIDIAQEHTWDNIKVIKDGVTKPTEAEFDAKVAELQAAYDEANAPYKLSRRAEYPSLAEQLDMQYHDSINGTTTWADAIQAVKDKYPKPE